MDQTKSNQIIKKWKAGGNSLKRIQVIEKRTISAAREVIFPLLCPTREFDWIPTWDCELLHTESGAAEYNCIFKTGAGFDEELWVCTRFQPGEEIHYSRFSRDYFSKLEISLEAVDHSTTDISWSIVISALNEKGNKIATREGDIRQRISTVIDLLESYLLKQ